MKDNNNWKKNEATEGDMNPNIEYEIFNGGIY
jgi:hypothetical protein